MRSKLGRRKEKKSHLTGRILLHKDVILFGERKGNSNRRIYGKPYSTSSSGDKRQLMPVRRKEGSEIGFAEGCPGAVTLPALKQA